MTEAWYAIDKVEELDSPVMVVFPDRVQKNIAEAIAMVNGNTDRLRPHIKTSKSPDVAKLMLAAGITQFKCATIAEAEMLAQCGAKDVLVAYQVVGPKLNRLVSLIRHYPDTKFSCLTDDPLAADQQSALFVAEGLKLPVYIDLNVGMNRTGIIPGPAAVALGEKIRELPGLVLMGLHAYDGHIRDADFGKKKALCDACFAQVEKLNESLHLPVIIMGGSPAFSVHCSRTSVQCSPGTFVYWDKGYSDLCPEQKFLPAVVLVTRVISKPSPGRICTDLGHKSVAAENEIGRRIHFLNASGLRPVGQSEEHLVLETDQADTFQVGQVLYGLPYHVCPTVALYDRLAVVENKKHTGYWKTLARDRSIHI